MRWRLFLVAVLLGLLPFQAVSLAAEPGSQAPPFQLDNLPGNPIALTPPARDTILILYFFDASGESIGMLKTLYRVVLKNPDIVSLLALSGENPEKLSELLNGDEVLASIVLHDNKGVTFAYGLAQKLPAAVIIGPGKIFGGAVAPVSSAGEALMATAEAFISLGLPLPARKIYFSLPPDLPDDAEAKLGIAYASILAGDHEGARRTFDSLAESASPLSSEAYAAQGFLALLQGSKDDALGKCARAPNSGFARCIEGLIKAGADRPDEFSDLLGKSIPGDFVFRWQKALALNMAARAAQVKGDHETALNLYKQAFALAPLNSMLGANLLAYHWQRRNIPAASAYAETLDAFDPADLLIRALVDEFKSEVTFTKDKAAQSRLEKRLASNPKRKGIRQAASPTEPCTVIVSDIAIVDVIPEMNFLPLAAAGVLKRSLESSDTIVTVKRAETLFAARRAGLSETALQNPVRVVEIGKKFSTEFIAFGEMGTYEGEYVLNLRIADAFSDEVIAVHSERFSSLDQLTPAIQLSAATLAQKLFDYRSRM